MVKYLKTDHFMWRIFVVSLIATTMLLTVSCTPKKPSSIIKNESTSTLMDSNELSRVPEISVDTIPISPVRQLSAVADSVQKSVKNVTDKVTPILSSHTEVPPVSDIETDHLKYEWSNGKFSNVEVIIQNDADKVTITENGNSASYTKVPPITTSVGNKWTTETFTMKSVTGETYSTALFFRGESGNTPFAIRLPKRSLFNRMPTKAEQAMVLKNAAKTIKCNCVLSHKVEKGTDANGIAAYRKIPLSDIQKANPGKDLTKLKVGENLCLKKICK